MDEDSNDYACWKYDDICIGGGMYGGDHSGNGYIVEMDVNGCGDDNTENLKGRESVCKRL